MAEDREQVTGFSLEEEEAILRRRYAKAHKKKVTTHRAFGAKGMVNINSMMDLMTIILVFLLMSSTEQPVRPELSDELHMPWSTSMDDVEDTMTITIATQTVLVNDNPILSVRDGDIPEGDRVSATSPIIPRLREAVEAVLHVEETRAIRRQEVHRKVATIIADHETTYRVLTYVMMTASAAGVQEFKFAILRRNPGRLWEHGGG